MKQKTNSFGVTSLVLGILGFLSPLAPILAIIFGVVGWRKQQKYSKAGLTLGIIWLAIQLLAIVFLSFQAIFS